MKKVLGAVLRTVYSLADKTAGYKQEKGFINDNRGIASPNSINNSTTNNSWYATKNQDSQFSADTHLYKSPLYFYPLFVTIIIDQVKKKISVFVTL